MLDFLQICILLATLALASCRINQADCGRQPLAATDNSNRIVGGKETIKSDWPWTVSLQQHREHICGGTLINRNYVLTAAHCFDSDANPRNYQVILGMLERQPKISAIAAANRRTIEKIILHPNYDGEVRHDVALIKLSAPAIFNDKIQPACLQTTALSVANRVSFATGWGLLSQKGRMSQFKRQVDLQILTDLECSRKYADIIVAQQLCAGRNQAKDTCQGDSGGGLYIENLTVKKWFQIGITSYGDGCGSGGVYGRVSYYISWIKKIIAA